MSLAVRKITAESDRRGLIFGRGEVQHEDSRPKPTPPNGKLAGPPLVGGFGTRQQSNADTFHDLMGRAKPSAAEDLKFIKLAIEEAKKCGDELERHNPRVGAIAVKNGQLLASAHRGELEPGEHAEFTALEKKLPNDELAGSTIYTTLEPCTYRNKPKIPCAQRLVERKVARVVIGMLDPNDKICGRGIWHLRESGIITDLFAHTEMRKVEELNRKFIREHRPSSLGSPNASVSNALALPETSEIAVDEEDRLISKILSCAQQGDFGSAESALRDLQALATNDDHKQLLQIQFWSLKVKHGNDAEARAELSKVAGPGHIGTLATQMLAGLDGNAGNMKAAFVRLDLAIPTAGTPDSKAELAIGAARHAIRANDKASAIKSLRRVAGLELSSSVAARVFRALADCAGGNGEPIQKAAFLCKAASVCPSVENLFSAAYALSGANLHAQSAIHYEMAIRLSPDYALAKNNLGVAYKALNLAGMQIQSYREASEGGETLAMANLAQQYISGGFYKEADAEVKRGRMADDPHENIGHAMVALSKAKKGEAEKWDEERMMALGQKHVFDALAEALAADPDVDSLQGAWATAKSTVAILNVVGNVVEAAWDESSKRRRFKAEMCGKALIGVLEEYLAYSEIWELKGTLTLHLQADGTLGGLLLDRGGAVKIVEWKRVSKPEEPKELALTE